MLLSLASWPALNEPLRSSLPTVFDGVELPKPDPDERFHNADGALLTRLRREPPGCPRKAGA